MRRLRPSRGFTLLEVLLATSLLALALTLAYGAIRAAVGSVRSGEGLIDRTEQVRIVQEFLRRQLSHAMPLAFEDMEDDGERKLFEADGESVRFVAPMPGYLSRGGPHVQWLAIERGRNGERLLFDHAQLNGYDPEDPKSDDARPPVVLLDGLDRARFEFRSMDPATGELDDWTDEWEDPQQMPVMVRLLLEFDRDDQRNWPQLEIPLKLASGGSVVPRRTGRFQPRANQPRSGQPRAGQQRPGQGQQRQRQQRQPRQPRTGGRPDRG